MVVNKINGKSLDDFRESFAVKCLIEKAISEFYKLDEDGKKDLVFKLDNIFSELFSMPEANIVFEEKEMNKDSSTIYMGNVSKFSSGLELMFRYFFAKRQQYQVICIEEDDKKDFSEEEFASIQNSYSDAPLTGKAFYRPYSTGLESYLLNYNKVDAILFSSEQSSVILEMIDVKRICNNLSS